MSDSGKRTIIVRKKVAGHGAHHGGSWKVAYADFVTAMMAFFLVMWIMGMDSNVRELIEGYFANPVGFRKAYGSGSNPLANGNTVRPTDARGLEILARRAQEQRFQAAAAELRETLRETPGMEELSGHIEIVVTAEGLRIELLEDGTEEMFFATGSARPTHGAVLALNIIGRGLQKLANPIVLEGHTDARPFGNGEYTNWELSVDRANAARRLVLASGLTSSRVVEVRGYAERNPRVPEDIFAPGNRRVSLLLPYLERQPQATEPQQATAAERVVPVGGAASP